MTEGVRRANGHTPEPGKLGLPDSPLLREQDSGTVCKSRLLRIWDSS